LCAKMLVNAGLGKVILKENYPDHLAREIFEEAGVQVINLPDPV